MPTVLGKEFLNQVVLLGKRISATPNERAYMLATVKLVANPARFRERHLSMTNRFVREGLTIGTQVVLDKVLDESGALGYVIAHRDLESLQNWGEISQVPPEEFKAQVLTLLDKEAAGRKKLEQTAQDEAFANLALTWLVQAEE